MESPRSVSINLLSDLIEIDEEDRKFLPLWVVNCDDDVSFGLLGRQIQTIATICQTANFTDSCLLRRIEQVNFKRNFSAFFLPPLEWCRCSQHRRVQRLWLWAQNNHLRTTFVSVYRSCTTGNVLMQFNYARTFLLYRWLIPFHSCPRSTLIATNETRCWTKS